MRRIDDKVLLRDNRDLSAAELEIAQTVCARIKEFVDSRDGYIAEHHLEPRFCRPDGMWSPAAFNDYQNTFREVISCRYEIINRLRLFVSFFSGYSLRRFSGVPGEPSFEALAPELDAEIEARLERPDEWVRRWMALAACVPKEYVISPPRLLGEIGWNVCGAVVNHDTCVYQERINLMYEAGVFDWLQARLLRQERLRVLEIGAGYGAIGYAFKKLFPESDYWICDLPEALLFSALYLSLTRPDCPAGFGEEAPRGFTYVPNYLIDRINGKFDLVINTLSFSEMSEHQLRVYAKKISEVLAEGILFEQNQDNRHMGLLCAQDILREYFSTWQPISTGLGLRATQGAANLWSNRPVRLPSPARNHPWHRVGNVAVRARWVLARLGRALIKTSR